MSPFNTFHVNTTDNFPTTTIGEKNPDIMYSERLAVRVIIEDGNNLCLVHIADGDYYKLPGGNIDDEESHITAIRREVRKETGCSIDLDEECIAMVEEFRDDLHQISSCYRAQLLAKGEPERIQLERDEGLTCEWVNMSTVAMMKLKQGIRPVELVSSIQMRDVFFLEEYLKSYVGL